MKIQDLLRAWEQVIDDASVELKRDDEADALLDARTGLSAGASCCYMLDLRPNADPGSVRMDCTHYQVDPYGYCIDAPGYQLTLAYKRTHP